MSEVQDKKKKPPGIDFSIPLDPVTPTPLTPEQLLAPPKEEKPLEIYPSPPEPTTTPQLPEGERQEDELPKEIDWTLPISPAPSRGAFLEPPKEEAPKEEAPEFEYEEELTKYGVVPHFEDVNWSGRRIPFRKITYRTEGVPYRPRVRMPHPSDKSLAGVDKRDQLVMYHHLNPEGRKAYAQYEHNRKDYWDWETSTWKRLPDTWTADVKLEGMKGYRPLKEEGFKPNILFPAGNLKETKVGKAIWGLTETDFPRWEHRSAAEKHGILGLLPDSLLFQAIGLDDAMHKEMHGEARAHGAAAIGGVKGYEYGKPLGIRAKILELLVGPLPFLHRPLLKLDYSLGLRFRV